MLLQIIQAEDWQPVYVELDANRKAILRAVWLSPDEEKELIRQGLVASVVSASDLVCSELRFLSLFPGHKGFRTVAPW
jgi:hypothetical protein